MALPKFKRLYTEIFVLQKLQDHLEEALNKLLGQPDVPKTLLEDVALSTTAKDIEHGLDRKVTRYMVCRRNAAASVYDQQASNPFPEKSLRLVASAPVTVSLVLF